MKIIALGLDFGCLNVMLILFSVVIKRMSIVLCYDKIIALFYEGRHWRFFHILFLTLNSYSKSFEPTSN